MYVTPLFLAIENFIAGDDEWKMVKKDSEELVVPIFTQKGNPEKRPYNQIIQEKVEFISRYADDDSVVWLADVDYACSPYALRVMQTIFEENPQVDYLSLLRGPGVPEEVVNIELSGVPLFRWVSCMGGSIMTRWSTFKTHIKEFFAQGPTNPWFDGPVGVSFWPFLKERYGITNPVYTIGRPSLLQHCRLEGSFYRDDKAGSNHMYACNYDPLTNPLQARIK